MALRRLDVLLLVVLVTARVRIDTLADLVAPRPAETVLKVDWLARLLSPDAWQLLKDWLTDPISLLLISLTFGLTLAYILIDLIVVDREPGSDHDVPRRIYLLKLLLLYGIIGTTVIAQAIFLAVLRHATDPVAYAHDGGVIQTEEAIKFLLQGKNPYSVDYTQTPLAQWGLDYRTALYHYPYLPWTLLFSLPFYLTGTAAMGWFDQRFVYIILFSAMLLMAPRLAPARSGKLMLVMLLGLNPILGSDFVFGVNDVFVLFWIVAAMVVAAQRSRWAQPVSLALMALACASKPTAWFVVPFSFMYLLGKPHPEAGSRRQRSQVADNAMRLAPFAIVFSAIILPFLIWDPYNFYDDVWAWSAGTSPTSYQIRGWGLANLVLAFNLVSSRLAYFPFWVFQLLLCVPLFVLLLRRQSRENSLANVARHGAILFFAYAFTSRFFNENYAGFTLSLLALGFFAVPEPEK